jgi:hypothetical protein
MASSSPYYNAEAPVVIQGKAVDSSALLSVEENGEWTRGEKQPGTCQDMFWAILFYAHLGAIGAVTAKYTPLMTEELAEGYADGYQNNGRRLSSISRFLDDNGGQQEDAELDFGMDTIWFILGISGLASFLISTVALMLMMSFAQGLIKMALFFNVLITALLALLALSYGEGNLALMSGSAFLFSLYYAYVVWNRIPFAASNLVTAISAVRANMGLAFFAYSNLIMSFLWSIWWAIAFLGTYYVVGNCNPDGTCDGQLNNWAAFLLLVSYFWTAQVIKNVVHVTVAGTVGTWWFTPIEASGCCSQGVRDSYYRSMTTSFGSICFGSLIVAIISAVKEVLHAMRDQNNSLLLCLAECLLGCIANLVEYFNSWAFVFVGLYGYSFIEGKDLHVISTFSLHWFELPDPSASPP